MRLDLSILAKIESTTRAVINRWWRPAGLATLVGSLFINGVWLPILTLKAPHLGELAALVTAFVAATAVREAGKAMGTAQ